MNLYEGQIVRVKTGLIPGREYGGTYFNDDMISYCGKIYKVAEVWGNDICCHFARYSRWVWNKAMLEPVIFEEGDTKVALKTELFGVGKPGDIIKVKSCEGKCSFAHARNTIRKRGGNHKGGYLKWKLNSTKFIAGVIPLFASLT